MHFTNTQKTLKRVLSLLLSLTLSLILSCTSALSAFADTNEEASAATATSEAAEASEATTSAQTATTDVNKGTVYLILAPYLVWDDINEGGTPNLYKIAQKGAIANMATKSRTRISGTSASANELALTISAGYWASDDASALEAYNASSYYENGAAGDAFERMTGVNAEGNEVVYLGFQTTAIANDEQTSGVVLGTLGQCVKDAGGLTAAIGNSDTIRPDLTTYQRPAALCAMDSQGRVALGDVSSDLLCKDGAWPYGIRTDLQTFKEQFDRVTSEIKEADVPGLVVLDPGDLKRASSYEIFVSEEIAQENHEAACKVLDTIVGYALDEMTSDDTIIIAGCASFGADGTEGLAPVAVYSETYNNSGILTSTSTHQEGIITALDITQLVLDAYGIEAPSNVAGNEVLALDSTLEADARIDSLDSLNTTVLSVNANKNTILLTYIILVACCLMLTLVLLFLKQRKPTRPMQIALNIVRIFILLLLCFPLASYMLLLICPSPATGTEAFVVTLLITVALWIITLLIWRFANGRIAMASIMLATSVFLIVDQLCGAPCEITGLFSYSPIVAARFYGLGNEGASILFGSTITGLALLFDELRNIKHMKLIRNFTVVVMAILTLFVSAAPMFGANVGVIIWGIVGYAIMIILMNGKRVTWKYIVLGILALACCLGAFIFYDLCIATEPSHLGQSIMSAQQGGLIELANIVARKVSVNLKVLTTTNWGIILVAVLIFLSLLGIRRDANFNEIMKENENERAALWASLFAGLCAVFTEDSGIVIPAIIFLYLGNSFIMLLLNKMSIDLFGQELLLVLVPLSEPALKQDAEATGAEACEALEEGSAQATKVEGDSE